MRTFALFFMACVLAGCGPNPPARVTTPSPSPTATATPTPTIPPVAEEVTPEASPGIPKADLGTGPMMTPGEPNTDKALITQPGTDGVPPEITPNPSPMP